MVIDIAPIPYRTAKSLESIIWFGTVRFDGLSLAQEVATVLNNVMKRKIHKTNIRFVIALHQVQTQMIDCLELVVIIRLGKIGSIEYRIAIDGSRIIETNKELRVDLSHLLTKELLEQIKAPTSTNVTPALSTVVSCL